MKFDELMEAARKMTPADIDANIKSIATDPRFAAVLGFIERRRGVFTRSVAAPKLANNPGGLAHVAGGLHETLNVLDSLKEVLEPSKRSRPEQPEQE